MLLSSVYNIQDSDQNTCGYGEQGLRLYCWCLGGLGDAREKGAGAQALAACLDGLEAPSRRALQGFEVCHGLEGSAEHQKPQIEASKEATGQVYGTLRGSEASGTNCSKVGPIQQLCLKDDISSFLYQSSQGF